MLFLACAIPAALAAVSVLPAAAAPSLQRVAGDDRVTTAVQAAQHGWADGADRAVLATSAGFADALAAAPLAARVDAPVLLTPAEGLAAPVAEELERLGVEQVVVLGGHAAISEEVTDALADLDTAPSVSRIAGAGRHGTAARIARAVGAGDKEAIIVAGADFPDAVSAGALAATPQPPPILLTGSRGLGEDTRRALRELDVERAVVVGGPAAVDAAVLNELHDTGVDAQRLAGADRYATSVAVAREAMRRHGIPDRPLVTATGQDHADALAAGVLASRLGGVLVLAHPDQPHDALDAFVRVREPVWEGAVALGGPAALDDDALAAVGRSLRREQQPAAEATPEPAPAPGQVAVDKALEQLGKPYVYGASGPDAFDCSGLTSVAWKAAGVDLPRTSAAQFASLPKVASPQPGDIVAYGDPISHIGMYIGDGQMVEAPRSGTTVRTASIERPDLRGFVRPGP